MSHLCFLTPLCWAGWLPWLHSPDIPAGPLSALGWRRLLRRGASLPSSSSQEWLATDRKPLTESSDSESAGGWQGADAGSCQTQTHARTNKRGWRVSGLRKLQSQQQTVGKELPALKFLPNLPLPALQQAKPHLRIVFQSGRRTGFISCNIVCSVHAAPPQTSTVSDITGTSHTQREGRIVVFVYYDGGLHARLLIVNLNYLCRQQLCVPRPRTHTTAAQTHTHTVLNNMWFGFKNSAVKILLYTLSLGV